MLERARSREQQQRHTSREQAAAHLVLRAAVDCDRVETMGDVDNTGTTSEVLMAAAKLLGKGCGEENKAFLLCKKADRNPEACLEQGKAVTSCSFNL